MKIRSVPAVLAMVITLSVTAAGTSPAVGQGMTKVPFTLNWKFYAIHGCIFLAQDRGYFANEKLEVTIDAGDGSSNVVNRLASGAYEIGFGDIAAVIKFNALNPDKAGAYTRDSIQRSIDIVYAAEKLPVKPKPEDIFTVEFLPPAAERTVPPAVLERIMRR